MDHFRDHQRVLKEALKRSFLDLQRRRGGRLRTQIDILISSLKAQGYLWQGITAVELFGAHGLGMTKDYAPLCSYLEFYEINSVFANYAQKFIKNATVIQGDSIQTVLNGRLKRDRYDFVVSDNPCASPYGDGYYEHFDFVSALPRYVHNGVIELSFAYDISTSTLKKEHRQRREEFYGKPDPSVKEAVKIYEKRLDRDIFDYVFVPRDNLLSFLALVLKSRDGSSSRPGL